MVLHEQKNSPITATHFLQSTTSSPVDSKKQLIQLFTEKFSAYNVSNVYYVKNVLYVRYIYTT